MFLDALVMDDLAVCMEYPTPDTAKRAISASKRVGDALEISQALVDLAEMLDSAEVGEPEARYTMLFDLKAVCTLNLGHHLYGDTYQRGALLSELAGELNRAGVEHEHDLPDFLPTLLRLLGRLDDDEDRRLLFYALIEPSLKAVNIALAESPGPWPQILSLLPALLTRHIPKGSEEIAVPKRQLEVLQNA